MAASSMESIAILSPRVTRVLGQNPGPFTLQGTNTYLIAPQSSVAASTGGGILPTILVDTGDGVEEYIPILERTLRGAASNTAGAKDGSVPEGRRYITQIALSHRHHDHVDGLPSVLALLGRLRSDPSFASEPLPLPRLYKKPDAKHDPALIEVLRGLPADSFEPFAGGSGAVGSDGSAETSPLWPLKAGDVLCTHRDGGMGPQTGERLHLQAIETPGHTGDHLCFLLKEERTLFTADHVLGQGTTVFEDLNAYIDSLTKCSDILAQAGPSVFHPDAENRLYPGHGPVVERGRFVLKQYLEHRLEREAQILELLGTPSPSKTSAGDGSASWSLWEVVQEMYAGFPEPVLRAAARGIFLHLHRLASSDVSRSGAARVQCLQPPEYARAAGAAGQPPRVPDDMDEWEQAKDSRWSLTKRAAI